MTDSRSWPRITAGLTLLAVLALGGCNRSEPESVGAQVDAAVDKAADQVGVVGARVDDSTETAKDAIGNAVDTSSQAMTDAAITTAIKAKLAADDGLQTLNISVETTAGRTVLEGTAPDADSRARASQVASGVDGVLNVNNRLMIKN